MEISTSTNIVAFQRGRERLPVEYCIRACAQAGYRVLDMNFCIAMNPVSRMRDDDWKEYVSSIRNLAESLGVKFRQSHLPYYDVGRQANEEKTAMMEKLIRRSIIGSGILGVEWAVTHPFTVYGQTDPVVNQQANIQYFTPHIALAKENGIGIALENEFEFQEGQPRQRVYCSQIGELIGLADAFSDSQHVGICYDFGHGNLTGGFHRQNLNRIGSRLKAVHIQDNHGNADEHFLPFFGSIDWKDAMAGLRDISYQGDLTFEVQEWARYLPQDMRPLALGMSLEVGKRLKQYYDEAES